MRHSMYMHNKRQIASRIVRHGSGVAVRNASGFTLIEMTMVLVLIGVVMAIVGG
jgi:prepilin-type N-terminal cleavage/methylation domain-containing protein